MTNPSSNFMLMLISLLSVQRQNYYDELTSRNNWDESYDFIVIGAGSAGSVVASRISEVYNVKVLLLEAGGAPNPIVEMPSQSNGIKESSIDWNYKSVPEKFAAFAYTKQQYHIPKGKVLGGTAAINNMIYNRGNKRDYDNWEHNFGAKGWSYNKIFHYFLKSENNTDPRILNQNPSFHSTDGLLSISSPNGNNSIINEYIKVAKEYDYPNLDINGQQQYGVMLSQQTIKDGRRHTTASAFLEPEHIRNRRNLHIVANAFVTKINIDKARDGKPYASGVEFYRKGTLYNVRAIKEVILSAGAINSPQVLMLSGIGPKEHLRTHKIPLVTDLPVGDNLQNHIHVKLEYDIKDQSSIELPILSVNNIYNFYMNKQCPLSQYPNAILNLNSDESGDKSWPNGYVITNIDELSNSLESIVAPYSNKLQWNKYFKPYLGRAQLTQTTGMSRPLSRGTVRLSSKSPYAFPTIKENILSNPKEVDTMVMLLKKGLEIIIKLEMRGLITITNNTIPGCEPWTCAKPRFCNSYLMCIVRQLAVGAGHECGTCRMGHRNDPNAVTDERLCVRKVRSLRVIDASVMPHITSGSTHAPTVMIAEKGSDMIKEDWNMI